ncbi:hypothetical protein [Altericroceibacterium endophyticum]|uniref:Uncharacterized protein n=1 Tax=Altericroceibacterium endophyticum TaxID=1808508 RepID=A0A6I4T4E3_9SPHN|nr:hypothetical protein [Altericroceibacterium endophyticum]MXO65072.1 hypothetical protein [Altericroceibacterium endophyticum]
MLGTSNKPQDPIYVIPMALALALAAFAGGGLGLLWDSVEHSGDDAVQAENSPDSAQSADTEAENSAKE